MSKQSLNQLEAKALRRDARKLETVARHLRERAKQLIDEDKRSRRAEVRRANFYSKPANVDELTPLIPSLS